MAAKEEKREFQISCLFGEKLGKNETIEFKDIAVGKKCNKTVKKLPYQIRISTKGKNDRRFMFCHCKDHEFTPPMKINECTTIYYSSSGDTIDHMLKDRDYTSFTLSYKLSTIMHAFTWFPFLTGFKISDGKMSLFYFQLDYPDNEKEKLPFLLKVEGFANAENSENIDLSLSIVDENEESKDNREARKEIEDKYKGLNPATFIFNQCQLV